MPTKIEWTDETWNPVTGCTKVGEGCRNCYAERMARRLAGRYGYPEAPNHFRVTLRPERLDEPLRLRKPRMVFTCSMGDLFHKDVPFLFTGHVFSRMIATKHTFQILTKRPDRMEEFILWFQHKTNLYLRSFRHIWLGVSVEDQATADERISILLETPAAMRFVSYEPALGPVDFSQWLPCPDCGGSGYLSNGRGSGELCGCNGGPWLGWLTAGGETGPRARPAHPDWFRSVRNQCQAAGVPFFLKSMGEWIKSETVPGDDWSQVVFMDVDGNMHEPTNRLEFWRVGKKDTGRRLDGREWNEMPEVHDGR